MNPPKLNQTVIDEVNKAYYSRLVEAPDRARTRALNAFTIVSAVAAALVAAGLANGFGRRPSGVQALGYATVVLWLTAGAGYLTAVALAPRRKKLPDTNDANESARRKIDAARAETRFVRWTTFGAHLVSLLALTATVALLAFTLFGETVRKQATVTLDEEGAKEVARVCTTGPLASGKPQRFRARVDPGALEAKFVELRLDAGACGRKTVRLRVRTELVAAVAVDSD